MLYYFEYFHVSIFYTFTNMLTFPERTLDFVIHSTYFYSVELCRLLGTSDGESRESSPGWTQALVNGAVGFMFCLYVCCFVFPITVSKRMEKHQSSREHGRRL